MKNQTYLCKTIGNWCGSAPELFGIYKTMSKSLTILNQCLTLITIDQCISY